MILNKVFYTLKPAIPRSLQLYLRRQIAAYKRNKYAHIWPIDPSAGNPPEGWKGWPGNKQFALVLTHDVETQKGHDRCNQLMDLEEELGFRSSFNFVPERYHVSRKLIKDIIRRGFEVGVHGLKHDGKLYATKEIFSERASKINEYLRIWGAVGFRSPAMHHNLDWIHELEIQYDLSTFDTDPFEPQADGMCTVFPFWVQKDSLQSGYVELPYTLAQDFTLFVIMKERSIDLWKKKLDWIVENGGMALLNTHPDYKNFNNHNCVNEEYPAQYFQFFLEYVKNNFAGRYWNALPREICKFWKSQMAASTQPVAPPRKT